MVPEHFIWIFFVRSHVSQFTLTPKAPVRPCLPPAAVSWGCQEESCWGRREGGWQSVADFHLSLGVNPRISFHWNQPMLVLLTGEGNAFHPHRPNQGVWKAIWHCYKEIYPMTIWYKEVSTHYVTLSCLPICRAHKTRNISGFQLLKQKADFQKNNLYQIT